MEGERGREGGRRGEGGGKKDYNIHCISVLLKKHWNNSYLLMYQSYLWLCANLHYYTSPVFFLTSFNMAQLLPLIQPLILLCSQFPKWGLQTLYISQEILYIVNHLHPIQIN